MTTTTTTTRAAGMTASKTSQRWGALLAALPLVAAALAACAEAPEPTGPPAAVATVPAGRELRYGFETTATSDALLLRAGDLPGGTDRQEARGAGRLHLAGTLALRGIGPAGDGTRVALRFEALPTHDWTVLGQPLLPDEGAVAAQVLAHEAFVDLTPGGGVRALRFRPGTPAFFRNLVRLVLSELQVERADADGAAAADGWTVAEPTRHGLAATRYAATRLDDGGERLVKRREGYRRLRSVPDSSGAADAPQVDGETTVEVAPGGWLRRVEGHERVSAARRDGVAVLTADSTFRAELLDVRPAPGGDVGDPRDEELDPPEALDGVSTDAGTAARQHRALRIDGLTPKELVQTLERHAPSGELPAHERFLWRATGLLRERPELCADVRALAERADMTPQGRALLLDVLVGAGSHEAQAALRAALAAPTVQAERRYALLYQRIGLLSHPDAETAALAAARHDAPGPETWGAAAHALGAVAGRLAHVGDPDRARTLAGPLVRALRATPEPARAVVLLGALGNAGLPEHGTLVAGWTDHADPAVRYAAVDALRKLRDDGSRGALVERAADPDGEVARRALRSLLQTGLEGDDRARLRALVEQRRVAEESYDTLVSLLARHLTADAHAVGTLRAILDQDLDDPRVKGRIRALLGE